jgi:predicted HTH domain antitoxin
MNLTLPIPDDIGQRLGSGGDDLSRRALEAFAVEEYRAGHLTLAELRRLLGFGTRAALDGFLKARGVFEEFTLDDLDQDLRDLRRVGL